MGRFEPRRESPCQSDKITRIHTHTSRQRYSGLCVREQPTMLHLGGPQIGVRFEYTSATAAGGAAASAARGWGAPPPRLYDSRDDDDDDGAIGMEYDGIGDVSSETWWGAFTLATPVNYSSSVVLGLFRQTPAGVR